MILEALLERFPDGTTAALGKSEKFTIYRNSVEIEVALSYSPAVEFEVAVFEHADQPAMLKQHRQGMYCVGMIIDTAFNAADPDVFDKLADCIDVLLREKSGYAGKKITQIRKRRNGKRPKNR